MHVATGQLNTTVAFETPAVAGVCIAQIFSTFVRVAGSNLFHVSVLTRFNRESGQECRRAQPVVDLEFAHRLVQRRQYLIRHFTVRHDSLKHFQRQSSADGSWRSGSGSASATSSITGRTPSAQDRSQSGWPGDAVRLQALALLKSDERGFGSRSKVPINALG